MVSARVILLSLAAAVALTSGTGSAAKGDTERVSVPNLADQTSLGTEADNGSVDPAISADGRFVAFVSFAFNLVVGDTNQCDPVTSCPDIFVYDRQTGATERVSVPNLADQPTLGHQTPNGEGNIDPAISADGRFVAFTSGATNLVLADTGTCCLDIFVHDRQTGSTERVSVPNQADQPTLGPEGCESGDGNRFPAISANGRFVAFDSSCDELVPGDTGTSNVDVFVHDRQTGATQRVSVPNLADQPTMVTEGCEIGDASIRPSISADGRFVAFESTCDGLVLGDSGASNVDVFVHDRDTGATERVSVPNLADQPTLGVEGCLSGDGSILPSISADGRFVAFQSSCAELVLDDTNGATDIFVHDRPTSVTERVSVPNLADQSTLGTECDPFSGGSGGAAVFPSTSADGRFVAFESSCNNLVLNDANGAVDMFVHDRDTGATERVSVPNLADQPSLGNEANDGSTVSSFPFPHPPSVISADGRFVTFSSFADNLVVSDTNAVVDIFVRDRGQIDTDGDGVPDAQDACPFEAPASHLDADQDGCTDTIAGLKAIVEGLDLQPNIEGGLLAKLNDAEKALAKGKTKVAEVKLEDFISQVKAQRGKALTDGRAALLVEYAENVILLI